MTGFSATFAGIATAGSTRVFAYNGATLLATVAAAGTGEQVVSVSGVGLINSVAVAPGDYSDWVRVVNITFTPLQESQVPEPSTVLAMGMAALGLARARRS